MSRVGVVDRKITHIKSILYPSIKQDYFSYLERFSRTFVYDYPRVIGLVSLHAAIKLASRFVDW